MHENVIQFSYYNRPSVSWLFAHGYWRASCKESASRLEQKLVPVNTFPLAEHGSTYCSGRNLPCPYEAPWIYLTETFDSCIEFPFQMIEMLSFRTGKTSGRRIITCRTAAVLPSCQWLILSSNLTKFLNTLFVKKFGKQFNWSITSSWFTLFLSIRFT